jgi:hypothetical protein
MDIIQPDRAIRGRFAKGVSGNPGGRPAMAPEVKEALEGASVRAAQRLVELVDSEDPRVALLASNAILDRLCGKPAQTVDAKVETTSIQEAHLRALQEINERRRKHLLELGPDTTTV